ncbi:MAG: hypothetical protein K8T20_12560 [Planctomycetes bacterium]|nr:hypothetical protein [Planctomycetota bacterium]
MKPRASFDLREPAIALAVYAALSFFANPLALAKLACVVIVCGLFLSPLLLPLAFLAWYGQPGPRSSERRRRPRVNPKVALRKERENLG